MMMPLQSPDAEQAKMCSQLDGLAGPWMHAAAGAFGGSISVGLFYPLDFLRTRMYACNGGSGFPLRNASQFFREVGIWGVYRGITVAVVSHGLGWGMYLLLFRSARERMFSPIDDGGNNSSSLGGRNGGAVVNMDNGIKRGFFAPNFLSACFASVVTGVLITPFNLIKTRRQLEDTADCSKTRGFFGSLGHIVKREGFGSLLRGVGPQILLTGNTTIHVTLYEIMKREIFHGAEIMSWSDVAFASVVSKVMACVICNPLEVVRTRLQDKRNRSLPEYRSMSTALCTIWRTEGIYGFYRGLPVNVCRVIPTTVMAFVLYEKSLTALVALNSMVVSQRRSHGGLSGKHGWMDTGVTH